jgi:PAS domain S-box-containing protein
MDAKRSKKRIGKELRATASGGVPTEKIVRDNGYFRLLVENAHDAIVLMNEDGTLRYVSPSIEPIIGYTPDELLHTDPFEFIHPDDVNEVSRLFQGGLDEPGRVERAEYRLRHKDGSWHVVEAIGKNLLHEPSVAGVVVNMRDITRYRRIEQELRKSEERYRYLVENLNDVVYTIDREGVLTYISPAIERNSGYKSDELAGQSFSCFVHPEDITGLMGSFEQVFNGIMDSCDFRMIDVDGAVRYIQTSNRPIIESGETVGLIGIMREITDSVQASEARRRTEENFKSLIRKQIRYYRRST